MDADRCLLVRRALRSLGYSVAADGPHNSKVIDAMTRFGLVAVPALSRVQAEERLVQIGQELAEAEALILAEFERDELAASEAETARIAARLEAQRVADGERPGTVGRLGTLPPASSSTEDAGLRPVAVHPEPKPPRRRTAKPKGKGR